MKKKIFTPFRSAALLVAGCFLMCASVSAQTFEKALTTTDAGLAFGTTTDLSGDYTISLPSGDYLTTDAGSESCMASSNPDVQYVITLEKLTDGKYYIKSGNQKANYATSSWNIVFDNIATTSIEWIINLTADNTIQIQKNATFWTKVQNARGRDRLYSDGGADNAASFYLARVVAKETVTLPVAGTYVTEPVNLTVGDNSVDLSGKYVIGNTVGGYMTANNSARSNGGYYSLLSSVNPQFAFDFAKQSDGTYFISSGDFQLVGPDIRDRASVSFEYLPFTFNAWTITAVDANNVTIQSADATNNADLSKFLVNFAEFAADGVTTLHEYKNNGVSTANNKFTLLKVTSIATGNVSAQTFDKALTTEDAGLIPGTATDLSGDYTFMLPTGDYLTTDAGAESCIASTNPDVKYVITLQKLDDGNYYIESGDKKANYGTNGWNIVFDNIATTSIEWIINLTADNTIQIQKNATHWTKAEFAHGRDRLYSDGGAAANAASFYLERVVTKETVTLPVAGTYVTEPVNLTVGDPTVDLSGKYVIGNTAGGYMTANASPRANGGAYSLLSSVNPQFAFAFAKQSDGTYFISSGDFQLVGPDITSGAGVSFEYLPFTFNAWTITAVDANNVTIQSVNADANAEISRFLVNIAEISAVDGTTLIHEYKNNGLSTGNNKFTLLKVTSIVTGNLSLTNDGIKSNAFQSAGQLMVTKTDNVKSIVVYSISGQKIYGASVNSSNLSIPVGNWSKGVYLVKLTDGNGASKNIKASIN